MPELIDLPLGGVTVKRKIASTDTCYAGKAMGLPVPDVAEEDELLDRLNAAANTEVRFKESTT